ncbi:P-loop NTPase fold protein [Sulfurovum sp.]|uniref:KAP family P-loop NTPase fold protein n=1 Tax=Sulfurovum sp. TaxID=1969726 RepID=UPI0035633FBD
MRLTVPPLNILENEGFSTEKDIFNRKQFGERLANLFENSQEDIVVALDAPWGEGKSTFVKMWQGYVQNHRESKFKTIYFDAFANDYQKDPFIALTAELYSLLKNENEEKKKEFKAKASNAIKSMSRGALKIGVRALTGGILDGTIVDSVEKDISELAAEQIDSIIADRLQNSKEDKTALIHFKQYLEQIAEEQGDGNPIIFIIDELDRCRPDFALELVEQIKHIFSVQGITFLLILNRSQLEASVKARYGNDVNASLYLQKFVNIWFTLPRSTERHDDHGLKYLKFALKSMLSKDETFNNKNLIELLEELIKYKKPSYREIERTLSYVALIYNMSSDDTKYKFEYQVAMAFVCYLRASLPSVFDKISANTIGFDDLLYETGLAWTNDSNESEFWYLEYVVRIMKFDYADKETRKQMIQNQEIKTNEFYFPTNGLFKQVANMLNTMENR